MKRKVNKVGPATLMVSLPAKWVRDNHLKKGDDLDVFPEKKRLIISTESIPNDCVKTYLIHMDSTRELSKRAFIMPYIRGIDKIKITFDSADVIQFVQKNIYILKGFEIVEQEKDYLILQNIVNIDANNFDPVFQRMFNVVISMLTDFKNAFKTGNFDDMDALLQYAKLLDKLDFYCRRILNVHGYTDKEYTIAMYCAVRNLECIGDILRDIIKMQGANFKKDPRIAQATQKLINLVAINRKFIQTKNPDIIFDIKEKEMELEKAIKSLKSPMREIMWGLILPLRHLSEEAL